MVRLAEVLLFFLSIFSYQVYGQNENVYSIFDLSKPASFPGGERDFLIFWREHLHYPLEALQKQIGGYPAISLVMEKDGAMSDIRVLRPIAGGCTAILWKAVSESMPCWNPAEANGNPVRENLIFYFYFHPYAGRVYFLGGGSINYDHSYKEFAALTEKDYYKVNVAPLSKSLPSIWAKLSLPSEARAAHVNVEAVVEYTISTNGILTDARLLHDPGYGCGKAALDYIKTKEYWVPQCYYDTCFAQKKTEIISFCTDTVALCTSEKIFTETELHDVYKEPYFFRPDYLRDTLSKSGWVKVEYVVEKDGAISSVAFVPTDDSLLMKAARKMMRQQCEYGSRLYTFCGLPCRVRLTRFLYFCIEDKSRRILKISPEERKPPLRNKVYSPEEIAQPATHHYGDYGLRHLSYNIWNYPEEARQQGLEGTVYIRLNIEEDGSVRGKIHSDIGGGCGEEALRIVQGEKWRWNPAIINGYSVESTTLLPVSFRLEH